MDISDPNLAILVDRFYARVREDPLIGPVFNEKVESWPAHLEKLTRFWSSITLGTGRYKGSPMAAHLKHRRAISPEMFTRWLALWKEVTEEVMEPEAAALLQARANRMGENLQSVIDFSPAGEEQPKQSHTPYRSTPVFDQDSLPAALRREHRTRAGTWGAIHMLDGELRLHFVEPPSVEHLTPARPGIIAPERTHWVEPLGPIRMRIDFHDAPPAL